MCVCGGGGGYVTHHNMVVEAPQRVTHQLIDVRYVESGRL